MNLSSELVSVCIASAIGSAFSVWGVVRHELAALRTRVDALESRFTRMEARLS